MPSPGEPVGGSSHPRAGETRAPLALLEGESTLGVSASLLAPPRSPAHPEASANNLQFVSFKQELSCKQPRCAKGAPDSKCHTSVQAATLPTSGICFFSLQNTRSSPHALGLLLEKLSDVERSGHDSPGCFWGRGAALGMAGPASSPWFQSITSQNSLKGPQPSAISYLLKSSAISRVAHKTFLYCIIKQLLWNSPEAASSTTLPASSVWAEGPPFCTIPLKPARIEPRAG